MTSKAVYELRAFETDTKLKHIEDKLEEEYGVPEHLLNEWGTLAIRMTLLELLTNGDDVETMLKCLDVYDVQRQLNKLGFEEE